MVDSPPTIHLSGFLVLLTTSTQLHHCCQPAIHVMLRYAEKKTSGEEAPTSCARRIPCVVVMITEKEQAISWSLLRLRLLCWCLGWFLCCWGSGGGRWCCGIPCPRRGGFACCSRTSRTVCVDLHAEVAVDPNTGLSNTKISKNVIKSNAHF